MVLRMQSAPLNRRLSGGGETPHPSTRILPNHEPQSSFRFRISSVFLSCHTARDSPPHCRRLFFASPSESLSPSPSPTRTPARSPFLLLSDYFPFCSFPDIAPFLHENVFRSTSICLVPSYLPLSPLLSYIYIFLLFFFPLSPLILHSLLLSLPLYLHQRSHPLSLSPSLPFSLVLFTRRATSDCPFYHIDKGASDNSNNDNVESFQVGS